MLPQIQLSQKQEALRPYGLCVRGKGRRGIEGRGREDIEVERGRGERREGERGVKEVKGARQRGEARGNDGGRDGGEGRNYADPRTYEMLSLQRQRWNAKVTYCHLFH